MRIQFSGTHAFQVDRAVNPEEIKQLGGALGAGLPKIFSGHASVSSSQVDVEEALQKVDDATRKAKDILENPGHFNPDEFKALLAQIKNASATTTQKEQHLFLIQGGNAAEDRLILANAERLGVNPASIESTHVNFIPMDAPPAEQVNKKSGGYSSLDGTWDALVGPKVNQLFGHWIQVSDILAKAVNPLDQLLSNAKKPEAPAAP